MSAPIQPAYAEMMRRIAGAIDEGFNGKTGPKKVGFVLLTAEFGKIDGGRVNYISNGERDDMIAMMKEWIARAEGRYVETQAGEARQ
jgi:hypothetical protein